MHAKDSPEKCPRGNDLRTAIRRFRVRVPGGVLTNSPPSSQPSAKPVKASVGHRALPSGYVALPTGSTPVPAQGSNRWSHRTSGVVETVSRATTAPTLISAGSAKPFQDSVGHRGLPSTSACAYRCCRMFRFGEDDGRPPSGGSTWARTRRVGCVGSSTGVDDASR